MRAKKLFTATDDLTSSRRYIAALIILQTKAPVHYSVLLATEVIFTDAVGTAATDGVYVYISPKFFRGLESDSQRAFLLAHEVSHIILRHPQRGKVYQDRGFFRPNVSFDHGMYNRAADYVINSDCKAMGFEPIPQGCYSDDYGRDDIVDSVYADLYQKQDDDADDDAKTNPAPDSDDQAGECSQPENQDSSGDSADTSDGAPDKSDSNDGERSLPEPAGHDHHLTPEYEGTDEEQDAAAREDEHDIRSSVDDGIEQLEAEGRDPARLPESVREGSHRYRPTNTSDTDWRAEFADRFTRSGAGGQTTWSRIHRRRFATLGVISPTSIGQIGRVSIVFDISASVDRDVANRVLGESAVMIDTLQPRDGVVVVWTNHGVHSVDEVYSGAELLDLEIPCGGGTYMTAGVEWLEQNGLESDLVIVFTDGEMWDSDWASLAERDNLVVVLDSEPVPYIRRMIVESGADTIVAQAA
jgi:predicted metal-dependent peptidase